MDLDLAHDYLDLDGLFTPDELAVRDRVRTFVGERIRPNIAGWYATATFPRELVKEMADLSYAEMVELSYSVSSATTAIVCSRYTGASGASWRTSSRTSRCSSSARGVFTTYAGEPTSHMSGSGPVSGT